MSRKEMTDKEEIRELIHAYSVAVTLRDWNGVRAVFCSDASWAVAPPFSLEFSGEGIADGIRKAVDPSEFLVQMLHSISIACDTCDHDRATAITVVNEIGRNKAQNTGLFLLGTV
jgi:hypothetical protein